MAQAARPRYVRQRRYSRLRHAASNLKTFLIAQGSRLLSSASGQTFTADADTEVFTANGHGFVTGKGPVVVSNSGGALPTGLAVDTPYWPIVVDENTFKLATTRKNAANGTNLLISTNGTGTQTVKYQSTGPSMLERIRQGSKYNTILAATDIDDL